MGWRDILKKYAYTNRMPDGPERKVLRNAETILDMYEGPEVYGRGKSIRLFCLDCAGGSTGEVALCHSFSCPLYPWRFGTNTPQRAKKQGLEASEYIGPNNYHHDRTDGLAVDQTPIPAALDINNEEESEQ